MKLYRENRRAERPLVLQSYMFGNSQMYQMRPFQVLCKRLKLI